MKFLLLHFTTRPKCSGTSTVYLFVCDLKIAHYLCTTSMVKLPRVPGKLCTTRSIYALLSEVLLHFSTSLISMTDRAQYTFCQIVGTKLLDQCFHAPNSQEVLFLEIILAQLM